MTTKRATSTGHASGLALNLASGTVPEWIEVLPAGPEIIGRDGRNWIINSADAIIAASMAAGALHVDYEHASEIKAPQGDIAPAAGWIDTLEARDGAIWAHVDWTPKARQMLADREYRFISPTFYFDKTSLEILSLVSVALTNQPNLSMTALNRRSETTHVTPAKETLMDKEQLKALCRKLGLKDEASPDAILAAIDALCADKDKALNAAQSPDLAKFVPRADFDKVKGELETATNSLAQIESETREKEVSAIVDEAVKGGKIAPASKDFYLAVCRKDGGLDEFRKFVASAPVLTGASDLDKKPAAGGDAGDLTADEKAVCAVMGLSEDQFKKARG
ncbi:MAG: hypothetical protein KDJ37_08825 [Hyphomicrobiaceae bacterium]|nr:hypothetical protein [Hyphomicrobiaceae bacterium]